MGLAAAKEMSAARASEAFMMNCGVNAEALAVSEEYI